jgi:hypothetical protein
LIYPTYILDLMVVCWWDLTLYTYINVIGLYKYLFKGLSSRDKDPRQVNLFQ